ncbi:putative pantothenate transporter [Macrophomina phaseolina]|uniref:Pantothenate transporter n=1 Tax=Macrophomina phaseolina TaxID=35725 RepID=A0ABQ8FY24_9PEZI|nr:putative pantothenate transporter [Macrophomina phaseolina]
MVQPGRRVHWTHLCAKIDWLVLSYICIAYFLNIRTRQTYNIGYILGRLQSQLDTTRYILPIGMAEAKNDEIVYALRFFIGFLVASAYLGTINILVSRYTPHEVGSAEMFSGYLRAGLYFDMNNRGRLSTRRRLLIFERRHRHCNCSIRQLAITRIERFGREPPKKATPKTTDTLLQLAAVIFHLLGIRIYRYFNYSVEDVNTIPIAGCGLQILFTLPAIITACLHEQDMSAMVTESLLTFCETGSLHFKVEYEMCAMFFTPIIVFVFMIMYAGRRSEPNP